MIILKNFRLIFLIDCTCCLIIFGSPQIVQAAVTLVSFEAFPGNGQVVLEWETASESDMLGFYITRNNQQNGNYVRVSDFIFTLGTPVSGLVYQYVDTNVTNGQTYYYKLEAVDNNYESEFFGPVSATPFQLNNTPTQTITATGSTQTRTKTVTPTVTPTQTINLTSSKTPTHTSTSPFSFVTNTPTQTATETPRISPTITFSLTPDFSITSQATRTFQIVSFNIITPTATLIPEPVSPFRQGLVGFIITILLGSLLFIVLIFAQRKRLSV